MSVPKLAGEGTYKFLVMARGYNVQGAVSSSHHIGALSSNLWRRGYARHYVHIFIARIRNESANFCTTQQNYSQLEDTPVGNHEKSASSVGVVKGCEPMSLRLVAR
jgi:hypothetical protein